jgi:hypothetical protein
VMTACGLRESITPIRTSVGCGVSNATREV